MVWILFEIGIFCEAPRLARLATGKYIQCMSNYCTGCRFDPAARIGPRACPFTMPCRDFLLQHEPTLAKNPRIVMQVRNLKRLTGEQKEAIRQQAAQVRETALK